MKLKMPSLPSFRIRSFRIRPVRFVLELFGAIVLGVGLGLGSAYLAVENGHLVDSVAIGGWIASPNAGTPEADPYSAAAFARTGEVALGSGEGLALIADRDSAGNLLTGKCDYVIAGNTPPARLWTLSILEDGWRSAANPRGRIGFHSKDVLREADGSFRITVSTSAKSGNWFPIRDTERLRMVMRLYDTPVTSGSTMIELEMPKIERGACL
ncbi:DUF1214 domain-containing protein [Rhodobium gokarnense]|uniref:DUF1214 domain-containing protein n=1 Tax=Rhodobium gokarnense TaxID=364296 RepID=A0ABT3HBX7_9HYPH|nr:DUF1214 domain-containing protein [Rhodobium gokarnense]MCW2307907.1 hypothetical protein [Rhodobium gokarnense]